MLRIARWTYLGDLDGVGVEVARESARELLEVSIDDLLLGLVPDGLPPTGSGDGVLGSSWELGAGESLESDLDLDGAGGLDLNEVGGWGRGDAADLDEVERDDGSLAVTDLEDTELVGIGVKGSVPGQDGGGLLGVGVADGDFELAWLAGTADTLDGLDGDTEGRGKDRRWAEQQPSWRRRGRGQVQQRQAGRRGRGQTS